MTKRSAVAISFALLAFCIDGMTGAHAQLPSGYVSSSGLDTNNCQTPTQLNVQDNIGPCRTFARLLSQLSDGGVGECVDAGFFQQLAITRAVTIDCKLGGGGFNTSFININAPGKKVHLRNISLTAAGLVAKPVVIDAADSVELENVLLSGSNVSGSNFAALTDQRKGPGKLSIRNSAIVGTADTPGLGILIAPMSGILNAVIDNVSVRNSTYGLAVGNGGRVMVFRSTFSQNSAAGIEADPGVLMDINDTLVTNNTTGIIANAGATIAISNSGINSNNTGISGATLSYGNNRFFANAISNGTPPTPAGSPSSENGLR
jgi:hypothetical protein